jgi:phosphoribosylformylglycinamidine synthase subunit PurL
VRAVFQRWDLEAVVIGRVTDDGLFRARWRGEEVCRIPVSAVIDDAPVYRRPAAEPADQEERQRLDLAALPESPDYGEALRRLLASPNLCSREWVYRQYDQFLGGNTVVRPGADAAVVRVEGTHKALALTLDCNTRYNELDPYLGGLLAVVEGARNCVAVGARPLAVSDCLNYGNPENPEVMWQFQQGVAGIRDACLALATPVVSGNVSFYNETDGRSIPPTPTIAMVGLLDDVEAHLTPEWKAVGDAVVLLGTTREELGGSEYLAVLHGRIAGTPPWIDLNVERRLHELVLAAAADRLLRSAHDVGQGGLAVALAECCFGGARHGVRVKLEAARSDVALFGESQSRMLISVRRREVSRLRDLARRHDIPMTVLGEVRGQSLVVGDLVDVPVETLYDGWRRTLERRLGG